MTECGDNIATYRVVIETADGYVDAEGENNLVTLQMTGNDGTVTEELQLNELCEPKFKKGGRDEVDVKALDVGLPVLIRLKLREHKGKNPWAVRYVKIEYNDDEAHFPVHDWIESEMSFTTGNALPHHKVKNSHVMAMLEQEVEHSKTMLTWIPRPGPSDPTRSLPRFVNTNQNDKIPLIFRPTEIWTRTFAENSPKKAIEEAMADLKKNAYTIDSLDSYESLYKTFEDGRARSRFLDRWKSDEEFGRQQLNGTAPTSLERCTQLSKLGRITDAHVGGLLNGNTLEQEMKQGRIYIVDFSELLKGVKRNKNSGGEQLYCPDALCLFHVNSNDDLVPIAIQLVPGDEETVFTPNDSEHDWLLAKMYFKVAFGCMHEWHYHFLLTHGVMEPIAVAVFRGLPRCHPIYKLLRPHLQTVTVINFNARNDLLLAGSKANQALAIEGEDLSRRMFSLFSMEDLDIPSLLQKRGLMDNKVLPKFYYRDDSVELWEIINNFVTEIIRHYYPHDSDVCSDRFLQDMMTDIAEEGIGWDDKATYKGVPYPLRHVEKLIHLCTTVIFTSSVQHSAVNFPQYDMYKFVPNGPVAMRLPPHKRGEATMERIMKSLPDVEMSLISIAIASLLSVRSEDEVYLGDYRMKLFIEEVPKQAIENFRNNLRDFSEKVKTRNGDVTHPYDWLLPENIASSISI